MPRIHPAAVVDPRAELAGDVEVGPYAVLSGNVRIAEGTSVGPHAVISGDVTIGRRCRIYPFSAIGFAPQDRRFSPGEPSRIEIGDDNVFREHATVHPGTARGQGVTRIGERNWFLVGSHVAHDCRVADDVTMANASVLSGHVAIGSGVMLSGFAGVHQFCRVGRLSLLSAYTAAKQDVPPFVIAHGGQARLFGLNRVGLRRAGFPPARILALRTAYRILFRRSGPLADRIAAARNLQDPCVEELVAFLETARRGVCRDAADASEPTSGEEEEADFTP